jgi:hypothetical protein
LAEFDILDGGQYWWWYLLKIYFKNIIIIICTIYGLCIFIL